MSCAHTILRNLHSKEMAACTTLQKKVGRQKRKTKVRIEPLNNRTRVSGDCNETGRSYIGTELKLWDPGIQWDCRSVIRSD